MNNHNCKKKKTFECHFILTVESTKSTPRPIDSNARFRLMESIVRYILIKYKFILKNSSNSFVSNIQLNLPEFDLFEVSPMSAVNLQFASVVRVVRRLARHQR